MTPDEVRAAVTQSGARADAAISALGDVGPLLTGLFPDGHIVIDPVSDRADTADGVTVTGTGSSGPFSGMGVTIAFSARPVGSRVQATATADEHWTFTDAFPPLASSIFDTLRFTSPALALDSLADAMTFTGTLIITAPMAPLDLMMPGVTHSITGEITTVSGPPELGFPTGTVPDILLYGPDHVTIDLGLVRLSELRYEIEATPLFDLDVLDWTAQGAISVTGTVPITVGDVRHDVLINTQIIGWGGQLQFWGDFSALGDISLADVAAFAGQPDLPVPFDVSVTSPVRLTEVTVLVTPATLSVDYITLHIQTREQWDIVADVLYLDAIDLSFRIDSPLSAPDLSGALTGLFGIGENGTLEVTADFGQQSFGGSLRGDDGPLSMREVYTQFTGDASPPVPDLSVVSFELGLGIPAETRPATYNAFLELIGSWHVSEQVELTDVMFSMRHEDGGTTFDSLAILQIQGIGAKIAASYDPAPDRQWEFRGETGSGQQIPIGGLFQTLADRFGSLRLPEPIARLVIQNIGVALSTGTTRLFLTCEALFPIDTATADIVIAIDTAVPSFAAQLAVTVPTGRGPFTPEFAMVFARPDQDDQSMFVAAYSHSSSDPVPGLKELAAAIVPSAAAYVPDGLTVDLRDAFIAVAGDGFAFGADLGVTIDFSRLPVIGDHLDLGVMGFDPLRFVAASAALTDRQVAGLNGLLPARVGQLPDGALAAGFLFDGLLRLGALEQPLEMPVADPATRQPPQPWQPPPTKDTTSAANALWHKVQRSFGPIYIDRIGVAYLHVPDQSARLAVLLDASLTVAGLTLSLTGLQAGLDLSDPTALPSFDLAGLGLSYTDGPLKITGAFLKDTIEYQGNSYTAYGGQAVIRTADLTIGAIGSYSQLPEGPSLFVYAFLDHAIGGPAFFFVTGIAAGFGYNRRLIPPTLETLADFPLVAEATGTRPPASSLGGELQRLDAALVPSPGDYFLMAGVRFTSFKMVDSFLLLVASFGTRFALDVLGLSTLTLPAAEPGRGGVTPVAQVQLALRATFVPEDGVFAVSAQLTSDSFLLSRNCRLYGGLAFSTWFAGEHAGDFVLTVGGYHPHYVVPAHYPVVPRLRFTWQVTPQLQMSGSAYYALTPSALMAGGSLSALYADESFRAWFDASMDFLISWQPYHYEATLHVAVGASYTFDLFGTHTISAHVGADVHLWGPDFGGTARIDLSVISFTISFGPAAIPLQPITWDRFRDTLLPAPAQVTTIALSGGAMAPGDGDDLGVVDPYALELRTDSVIPSSAARRGPAGHDSPLPTGPAALAFGVSPLGRATMTATHRIEISYDNGTAVGPVDDLFSYEPVTKSLPYALWGGVLQPSLSAPEMVQDLLTGYTVRPLPPDEPPDPASLPVSALLSPTPLFTVPGVITWAAPQADHYSDASDPARSAEITSGLTAPGATRVRAAIAEAVLKGTEIDFEGFTAAEFLQVPQVVTR